MTAPDRIDACLAAEGWATARRTALAGDASARRYWRLVQPDGRRAILMDSPNPGEDVLPFIAIGRRLAALGLSTPAILGGRPEQGLLLIEDFGDATFSRLLAEGTPAQTLYPLAVAALVATHRAFAARPDEDLPRYDDGRFVDQVMLFAETYLPAALGAPAAAAAAPALAAAWRRVVPMATALPWSLLYRDFHVDNLMRLGRRSGVAACGILDFQGAGLGPVAYDLVSLLEDARRDVPPALAEAMIADYLSAFPDLDPAGFRRGYAILGAIRHTRILAVFARLWLRERRPDYLGHMPRVWRLLEGQLARPELAPVADWFDRHLPAGLRAPLFADTARPNPPASDTPIP